MAFLLQILVLPLVIMVLGQEDKPSGPTQPGTISSCNKWYTVQSGDSCYTVETDSKISHEDFRKWNPAVSEDYSTMTAEPPSTTSKSSSTSKADETISTTSVPTKTDSSAGTTSSATTAYSIRNPTTSINITTPTVDMSWPPKKTQAGQPKYCTKWYLVGGFDTCNTVYNRFASSMTKEQLHEWNPSLADDCSGLYYGWWVCVGVQPQSSLTLTFSTAPANVTIPTYDPFTPIVYPTINSSFAATPTQTGLAADCKAFYKADSDDTCTKVLEQYDYITREEFYKWNPALNGNCDGLWANYWYCVASFSSDALPLPPTVTKAPALLPSSIASDCVAWYQMTGSDTCESISTIFGTFSEADFIKMNPNVWSDCSNIETPANASTLLGTLLTNDWEHFNQPIPFTQQVLKGRILLSRRVRPRALYSMIEGGLAQSQQQIRQLGADTRLRMRDNPYSYGVPGCHFIITSKTSSNRPTMTYGMVRTVFLALEKVLVKSGRNFEASFVLTDVDQVTWGHGEVWERAPVKFGAES
ncbi:MAG: hypothetical protein Q9207_006349 [Kuettlingeria erythrocarpa]